MLLPPRTPLGAQAAERVGVAGCFSSCFMEEEVELLFKSAAALVEEADAEGLVVKREELVFDCRVVRADRGQDEL